MSRFRRGNDSRQSNVSRAEDKLYHLMLAKGLSPETGYYAHIPITEHEGTVEWVCRPDFLFAVKRVAVFLDGPHHLKKRTELRDAVINGLLPNMGYKVLRFQYKPPLSNREAGAMVAEIVEAVNKD